MTISHLCTPIYGVAHSWSENEGEIKTVYMYNEGWLCVSTIHSEKAVKFWVLLLYLLPNYITHKFSEFPAFRLSPWVSGQSPIPFSL